MGDFRILVMPDHATPLSLMTHTNDPIPYMIYDNRKELNGVDCLCEESAATAENYVPIGHSLIERFINS